MVNGIEIWTLDLCQAMNTDGRVYLGYNLESYAGATVDLAFLAVTDDFAPSSLCIDDVRFGRPDLTAAEQKPQDRSTGTFDGPVHDTPAESTMPPYRKALPTR